MNFTIEQVSENGLQVYKIINQKTKTSVSILPDHGALLHAFEVMTPNGPLNIIENYKSEEEVQQELTRSFKSAKLSPFACRIPEGKYNWEGKAYEFKTKFFDGSAIHGLLHSKPYQVTEVITDESQASIHLQYRYQSDDEGYPFDYTCDIVYSLRENDLVQLSTTIHNHSTQAIPLADGWHPYFKLGEDPINTYTLEFASNQMLEFDSKLIPTGKLLNDTKFSKATLLEATFLDNCFLLNNFDQHVCTLTNPGNGIQLQIHTNSHYPYLQLYTPDDRKSIAIENLSGAPNCFENKMGLIVLPPNQEQVFKVKYQIKKIQ